MTSIEFRAQIQRRLSSKRQPPTPLCRTTQAASVRVRRKRHQNAAGPRTLSSSAQAEHFRPTFHRIRPASIRAMRTTAALASTSRLIQTTARSISIPTIWTASTRWLGQSTRCPTGKQVRLQLTMRCPRSDLEPRSEALDNHASNSRLTRADPAERSGHQPGGYADRTQFSRPISPGRQHRHDSPTLSEICADGACSQESRIYPLRSAVIGRVGGPGDVVQIW